MFRYVPPDLVSDWRIDIQEREAVWTYRMRIVEVCLLVVCMILIAGVYTLKHRVRALEQSNRTMRQKIEQARHIHQTLEAEWAYLTRADRLMPMSQEALGHEHTRAHQIVDWEQWTSRGQTMEKTMGTRMPPLLLQPVLETQNLQKNTSSSVKKTPVYVEKTIPKLDPKPKAQVESKQVASQRGSMPQKPPVTSKVTPPPTARVQPKAQVPPKTKMTPKGQ